MSGQTVPPEGFGDRATMPGRAPRTLPALQLEPPPRARITIAIAAGFAMGRARLTSRASVAAAGVALALAATGALIERSAGSAGAVDRALAGTFGLVVPLFAFWILGAVTKRGRLDDAAWPAARFGLARRDVALGLVLAALVATAAVCSLCAAAAVLLAGSRSAPPLAADALISAWIGALTGAAYVAWFAAGATLLRSGAARYVVLLADFLIGGSTGLAGALLPRANAANLLGAAAPLGLDPRASTAILVVSVVALTVIASLRCRE